MGIGLTTVIPTFEQATAITLSAPFIVVLIVAYIIPLFLYLIWGALTSAKTLDGRTIMVNGQKKTLIETTNFWIGLTIFGFVSLIFYILIAFPIFLIPFE